MNTERSNDGERNESDRMDPQLLEAGLLRSEHGKAEEELFVADVLRAQNEMIEKSNMRLRQASDGDGDAGDAMKLSRVEQEPNMEKMGPDDLMDQAKLQEDVTQEEDDLLTAYETAKTQEKPIGEATQLHPQDEEAPEPMIGAFGVRHQNGETQVVRAGNDFGLD